MTDLEAIKANPKNGNEPFSFENQHLDFKLSDFWSRSQSDLLNNTLRGALAEYIVRQDLGIKNLQEANGMLMIWKPKPELKLKSNLLLTFKVGSKVIYPKSHLT